MKSSNKTLVLNIYDTLSGAINSQISLINNLCDLLSMQQYNFNLNANGRILDLVLSSRICEVSTSCDPVVVEDSHHPSSLIIIPIEFHVGSFQRMSRRGNLIRAMI